MTPIQLIQSLAARIRLITQDIRMEESDGEHILRAPHVWTQSLPEKRYEGEEGPADYPFVLVMLGGGAGVVDGRVPCNVAVLVGGYDDGQPLTGDPSGVKDQQGWTLPAMLAWRIITSMAVEPTIGPFQLDLERLTWELPGQEQPAPQWFGIINMVWNVPVPTRQFDLENMPTHVKPPCEAALVDDILTFMEGE